MARVKKFMDLFGNYTAADDWFLNPGDTVDAIGDIRDNTMKLTGGDDIAHGGDGKDLIWSYGGSDILYGEAGNDTLYGGDGNDVLYGGDDRDVLAGDNGNDTLEGGGDNDLLIGGEGSDRLRGGDGDDQLHGGAGDNSFNGGAGNDILVGGADADWAYMTDLNGNDRYNGNEGFDVADYFNLNGQIRLTPVSDGTYSVAKISGGRVTGTDVLDNVENVIGTNNNDTMIGYTADDFFQGQEGDDVLIGNGGRDSLYGGNGNDTLHGGSGYDTLNGGFGDDTFRFDQTDMQVGTPGPGGTFLCDLIADYTAGDRIDLSRIDANTSLAGDQRFVLTERHLSGASGEVFVQLITDGAITDTYRLTGYVTGTSTAPDFHINVVVNNGFNLFQDGNFVL